MGGLDAVTREAQPGAGARSKCDVGNLLTPAGLPDPTDGFFRGFYDIARMGFTADRRIGSLPSEMGALVIALFSSADEGPDVGSSMEGGRATISVHDHSQASGRPSFALRLEAFADSLRMMRVYFPHVLDLLETTGEQARSALASSPTRLWSSGCATSAATPPPDPPRRRVSGRAPS